MEYLVHSAFYFEEDLAGIWVGKSEASKETIGESDNAHQAENTA